MAGPQDLQSFIGKFYHLWQTGVEADLHVRCFAGQAFVHLHAGLGYVQPPPYHAQHKNVSPSRLRRRHRREQERKKAENAAAEKQLAESENESEIIETTSSLEKRDTAEKVEVSVEETENVHVEETEIERVEEIDLSVENENSNSVEETDEKEIEVIIQYISTDYSEIEENVEEEIFECRQCNFVGKTAGGVKIHEKRKHRDRLTSL